jgi:mRNA-degrading endonuclease toxin of MazEF toxin-antitoxin module
VVPRPGQPVLRLIVSADFVNANEELPVVLAVQVVDADPDSLMATRVGGEGWARALSIEPIQRRRLVEHVGTADGDTMEQVSHALRAAQDL